MDVAVCISYICSGSYASKGAAPCVLVPVTDYIVPSNILRDDYSYPSFQGIWVRSKGYRPSRLRFRRYTYPWAYQLFSKACGHLASPCSGIRGRLNGRCVILRLRFTSLFTFVGLFHLSWSSSIRVHCSVAPSVQLFCAHIRVLICVPHFCYG